MTASARDPHRRPWHATTTLAPLAVATWTIEPERLAPLLPPGVVPDLIDVDGSPTALGSIVAFVAHRFRFRGAPFLRRTLRQVDHRVHVRRGGRRGIWFVAASLDSPLVVVPRALWAMPWHHDRIQVDADIDGARHRLRLRTEGGWRSSELDLVGAEGGEHLGGGDATRGIAALTDPVLGWYPRTRGGVAAYEVRHPPFELHPSRVEVARAGALIHLGLVAPDQPPLAAGVTSSTPFDLLLPPRRITGS